MFKGDIDLPNYEIGKFASASSMLRKETIDRKFEFDAS